MYKLVQSQPVLSPDIGVRKNIQPVKTYMYLIDNYTCQPNEIKAGKDEQTAISFINISKYVLFGMVYTLEHRGYR